jgi:hypothetical protein
MKAAANAMLVTPATSLMMMFKAIGLGDFSICRGRRAIIRLI